MTHTPRPDRPTRIKIGDRLPSEIADELLPVGSVVMGPLWAPGGIEALLKTEDGWVAPDGSIEPLPGDGPVTVRHIGHPS